MFFSLNLINFLIFSCCGYHGLLFGLLLFPLFGIKNVKGYLSTILHKHLEAGKNAFYLFKNQENINWRSIVSSINKKLFKYSENHTNIIGGDKCLITDDTDFS